jgi:hypothetical protein
MDNGTLVGCDVGFERGTLLGKDAGWREGAETGFVEGDLVG